MENPKNPKSAILRVEFCGQQLIVMPGETPGETFVALKPIVTAMGLDWDAQRKRVNRHTVLFKGAVIMTVPSVGGAQEAMCLPLNRLNFWLATIEARRVRPGLRHTIERYQEECADALYAHVFEAAPADEGPAEQLMDDAAKLRKVTETRLSFGVRAAQQMWFRMGLETVPAMFEPDVQPDLFADGPAIGRA